MSLFFMRRRTPQHRKTGREGSGGRVVGGVFALAQTKPTRNLLFRLRPPGRGPTDEEIARGHFEVIFLAEAGDTRLKTRVSGGDPGSG